MIASGYLGALLVAGAFLSVGAALSAATKNQVIAFVLAVAVCFVFAVASYPLVTDFLVTQRAGAGRHRAPHRRGRPLPGFHPRHHLVCAT